MADYVYTDHAQYTIKTYANMALFRLVLNGPLSVQYMHVHVCMYSTIGILDLPSELPSPNLGRLWCEVA